MASENNRIEIEKATDEPITMPEADSVQFFETFNTLGDDRYPPVRRPPIYPIIMAPESPKQET
jgi:hypothetical protein